MNLRALSITVAVLAALCAAAWFLNRPAVPVADDARVSQPVLAPDLATRSVQITLADQGKTVRLARQPDGSWRVASYYDLPADFSKLSTLIGNLTDTKIQRLVTTRPDRLARLEFKDTAITLLDGAHQELWHLSLGKNAEGGGRFIRYGTEEKGYQAGLNVWLDTEPKNWADSTLLNLKQDDIASLELSLPDGGSVTAHRAKKDDPWTAAGAPEGKRLKADRVTSILGYLLALHFTDSTATDDASAVAARAHSRTVKLTTFDHKTLSVVLGRKPEEKKPKPAVLKVEAQPAEPVPPANGAAAPAKPAEPGFETIPAGPVFAFITSSDEKAPINDLMKKRSFEISDYAFTSLPASPADLWEDKPVPSPAPKASGVSATTPPVSTRLEPPGKPAAKP